MNYIEKNYRITTHYNDRKRKWMFLVAEARWSVWGEESYFIDEQEWVVVKRGWKKTEAAAKRRAEFEVSWLKKKDYKLYQSEVKRQAEFDEGYIV